MIPLNSVVVAGNPPFMLPAAAAIAVWLLVGRFWKMAALWVLLFGAGLNLVVVSKVYAAGLGFGLPELDFKAFSGHAMLTTAVVPVLIYLLLQSEPSKVRAFGAWFGILFGVAMSIILVAFDFHTWSEAVGGFLIGSAISVSFIRASGKLPTLYSNPWQLPVAILVVLAILYVEPAKMDDWITEMASHLSSHG